MSTIVRRILLLLGAGLLMLAGAAATSTSRDVASRAPGNQGGAVLPATTRPPASIPLS